VRVAEEHVCAGGGGDQLIQREFFALIPSQRASQALRQTGEDGLDPLADGLAVAIAPGNPNRINNRLLRSRSVPIAERLPSPMIKSPSQ